MESEVRFYIDTVTELDSNTNGMKMEFLSLHSNINKC